MPRSQGIIATTVGLWAVAMMLPVLHTAPMKSESFQQPASPVATKTAELFGLRSISPDFATRLSVPDNSSNVVGNCTGVRVLPAQPITMKEALAQVYRLDQSRLEAAMHATTAVSSLSVKSERWLPSPSSSFSATSHQTARPAHYQRSFRCTLTAYGPGYQSTGKNPSDPAYGITASGTRAVEGKTIAVDPTLIPIGSTVFIEGLGYRRAEDIGGAVRGSHIDVFFDDDQVATRFGVKEAVQVYILSSSDDAKAFPPIH